MSLVKPDTFRKKLLGNIAALQKKCDAEDAACVKRKEKHIIQINGYNTMIKLLDEQNPPLPFVPPIEGAGEVVAEPTEDEKAQQKLALETAEGEGMAGPKAEEEPKEMAADDGAQQDSDDEETDRKRAAHKKSKRI